MKSKMGKLREYQGYRFSRSELPDVEIASEPYPVIKTKSTSDGGVYFSGVASVTCVSVLLVNNTSELDIYEEADSWNCTPPFYLHSVPVDHISIAVVQAKQGARAMKNLLTATGTIAIAFAMGWLMMGGV